MCSAIGSNVEESSGVQSEQAKTEEGSSTSQLMSTERQEGGSGDEGDNQATIMESEMRGEGMGGSVRESGLFRGKRRRSSSSTGARGKLPSKQPKSSQ